MDNRKAKRSRSATILDDGHWDCSFCTYRNKSEAFKCEICNIRKGTATRKPRMTQVTQQFVKIENQIEQERKKEKRKEVLLKTRATKKHSLTPNHHNRFANAQTISITVNDVTVFITDIELTSLESENEILGQNLEIRHNGTKNSNRGLKNEFENNKNISDLNNTDENTSSNSNSDENELNTNKNLNENESTNDTSVHNTTTNNHDQAEADESSKEVDGSE